MKKRGFTLIELLAVIIILAVIALIATPLIMNIIEESRKSSFRVSVENMIRAMETDQATQGFIPLSYQFPLDADTTLKLDGKIDDWQGKSSIDQDGKTEASIYNGTYCAYKKKSDNSVSIEKVDSKEECLDLNGSNLPVMMEGELASLNLDITNPDNVESIIMSMFTSNFLNGPVIRQEIESIKINNTKEVPGTVLGSFDVSENQDESVIAYYSDNNGNGLYEIVIGGEGGVSAPTNARWLFVTPSATTIDVSYLDTSNATDMTGMFFSCTGLTDLDVSDFNTSQVTDMSFMFYGHFGLTNLNINNFDTSNVMNMKYMFGDCRSLTTLDLSDFDTSQVTDMSWMFDGCENLTTLDVSSFDTSNVTNMKYMFKYCTNLTELDVSKFDTSKVTDMNNMFYYCSSLTELDVSNFDTSQVTDMTNMFYYCFSLTELDVSNFDTSNVTNMSEMFDHCTNLTELDLSNFNTSKVTNMSNMFVGSGVTSLDLSNFDTSKVTDMQGMFFNCDDLISLDLRNMTFDQVTSYSQMFRYIVNGINIIVKDSNAKTFIESRLSDDNITGTVTIAS